MKQKTLLISGIIVLIIAVVVTLVLFNKNKRQEAEPVVEEKIELPINQIPVTERPFITLSPDASGRNLELLISGVTSEDPLEYELLYNTAGSQEGALGAVNISGGEGPFTKNILLGTRSAGGATTYHEGVTGGSLDVIYDNTRLKEQFNYLEFDPAEPTLSSSDVRFSAALPATSLKKGDRVVVMKTFGLPIAIEGTLVAGPYTYQAAKEVKGNVKVSMKLPAGTYENAAVYAYDGAKWLELKTSIEGEDTLVATALAGNVFVVVTQ